jgi:CotS family spore coat protein
MKLEQELLPMISIKFKLGDIKDFLCVKEVKGVFAVKKMKVRPKNFLYSNETIIHLRKNGFNNTCEYIKCEEGEPYLIIGDEMYVVSKWLNGEVCDYTNFTQLKTATVALAKMHLASKGFRYSEKAEPRQKGMDWHERFGHRCDEILSFKHIINAKEKLSIFDALYLSNIDYYYAKGVKAIEMLDYTEYSNIYNRFRKENGFCHHDIANHNVIMLKDEAYLIDFDYVYSDIFLHDLGSLIIRNMKWSKWDMEKAWYIIKCYDEVISVKSEDIEVIKQFISFPQDFWQVGLQYYVEKQQWSEEAFLSRLMRFISQKEMREKFLSKFKPRNNKIRIIR